MTAETKLIIIQNMIIMQIIIKPRIYISFSRILSKTLNKDIDSECSLYTVYNALESDEVTTVQNSEYLSCFPGYVLWYLNTEHRRVQRLLWM